MKIVVGVSVKWHARIAAELDAQDILISYVHFLTPGTALRGLTKSPFDYLIHNTPTKENDDGDTENQSAV